MKNLLDESKTYKPKNIKSVLDSIIQLPDQVSHAWDDIKSLPKPSQPHKINNIHVIGMGGSSLGAHVIKTLFTDQLRAPLTLQRDYHSPAWINKNTLTILSSYSGTTEEVLFAYNSLKKTDSQLAIITSGGELKKIAIKNHIPTYVIKPTHNPSGQPRMALGYALTGMMGLLALYGLIKISTDEIQSVINVLKTQNKQLGSDLKTQQNLAKKLAFNLVETSPILIAAEHLEGMSHVMANQINENAKNFSEYRTLPELNHHLLEGLKLPKNNCTHYAAVFIESKLYHQRNQKRFQITQQIVKKHHWPTYQIELKDNTKLNQVFQLLSFGSWVSFYLSLLNKVDPTKIPWVDYLKTELKK